jgi:phosphotransferase system enzyme I (PtsI)
MNIDKSYKGSAAEVMIGIPASSGIAIGTAFVIKTDVFVDIHKHISENEISSEIERYRKAQSNLVTEFNDALSKVPESAHDLLAILQADLMMVEDEFQSEEIINHIKNLHTSETALILCFEQTKNMLKHSSDELFRERITELDNILKRFLINLGKEEKYTDLPDNCIIIAQFLTPTELLSLRDKNIQGIVTEVGGITSHLAILSRSFSLPAVISVNYATSEINNNDSLIIDGFTGQVFINPDEELSQYYAEKKEKIKEHLDQLGELIGLPCITTDGREINLWCNANNIEDVKNAKLVSSVGLGLVRTESQVIALNRFPNEIEQYEYYKDIADTAYPMIVTLRAFDVGTDKYSDNLLIREENPALGLRGIRYLLAQKDLFKIQLKAILKASRNKNIRLLLPMITSIEEVISSKQLVEECKQELLKEDETFDKDILIGLMIETPAAALIADELSQICDFFSIGTNDLTQYCLAADRTNELLSEFFNTFHPGVLRLIEFAVNAGHKNGIPVAICGEMAGHPFATPLLIGMGVDELSVAPSLFLEVKEKILSMSYEETKAYSNKVLKTTIVRDIFNSIDT